MPEMEWEEKKGVKRKSSSQDSQESKKGNFKQPTEHIGFIEGTVRKIGFVNPIQVGKSIVENIGTVLEISATKAGLLKIKCKSDKQLIRLLAVEKIAGVDVKCSREKVKTTSKGVIYGVPLDLSDEEI